MRATTFFEQLAGQAHYSPAIQEQLARQSDELKAVYHHDDFSELNKFLSGGIQQPDSFEVVPV